MPMKVFLPVLLAAATATTSVQAIGDMLSKPHRTITQHQQLCIPEADIVQCDLDANGRDKEDIMYDGDGHRMFTWNEYSVVKSAGDRATAMWSPLMSHPTMKPELAATGVSSGSASGMDMWKDGGTVTEGGITYTRYILRYDEGTSGNADAENQRQVVDSGLLPDRWEYLERADGSPYVIRQYSGRNRDSMYEQTMFMMAQELTQDEIANGDATEMAMDMATRAVARRRNLRRRRTQLEFESQVGDSVEFQQIEFPLGCLDSLSGEELKNPPSACIGVFRSIDVSAGVAGEGSELEFENGLDATYRIDAVLRDDSGRSAELYGELVVDALTGELQFVQGAARGCTTPGAVKIGGLAELSITTCLSGEISWEDDLVTGRLELSAQCKASVSRLEGTIELAGFIDVMAQRIDGTTRFTGLEGGLSLTADADVLALALATTVAASPNDVRRGDDWVTRVYVTPSLEYNLFLFSGSLSYTFRIAQIGPRALEATSTPRAPRNPLPPITILRDSGFASMTISSAYPLSIWESLRGSVRDQVARGFQVVQRGDDDRYFDISGLRLIYGNGRSTYWGRRDLQFHTTHRQVNFADDEYIVRMSGFWYFNEIEQLVIDTNKGRTFEYTSESTFFSRSRPQVNFDFRAEDGEALYTIDAYVSEFDSDLTDLNPHWGEAPESECSLGSCLSREAPVYRNPLQCTGWPSTRGFSNNQQRCEFANDQLDDGFLYVYNSRRGTASAECGMEAECWCCRRPVSK